MSRQALETVQRHPVFEKVSVKVAFSPACNYACTYCGGSAHRASSPNPAAMEDYRGSPLSAGLATTAELLESLKYLHAAGFETIRPTGGEPTLRPDWRQVIDGAYDIGYRGIDITTNAENLAADIEAHEGKLPKGLSLVKISLDTLDATKFSELSGGRGHLENVVRGVDATVKAGVPVRLNTVVLHENLNEAWISQMVQFCADHKVGAVQFLDLVHYPNMPGGKARGEEWAKQFVDFKEFQKVFAGVFPEAQFTLAEGQYGVDFWTAQVEVNGQVVRVNFKDSTQTMRDEGCNKCKTYCQEGRCLIRVGTDANATPCPDYKADLPNHFNVLRAIEDGTFDAQMGLIAQAFASAHRERTIEKFAGRHGVAVLRTNTV